MTEKMTLEQAEKYFDVYLKHMSGSCDGCPFVNDKIECDSFQDSPYRETFFLKSARIVIAAREAERDAARRDAVEQSRVCQSWIEAYVLKLRQDKSPSCYLDHKNATHTINKYSEATDAKKQNKIAGG